MTEAAEIRGHGRDRSELHRRLGDWFRTTLAGADPVVSELRLPEANGMSSETVLFDLVATIDGERDTHRCVARIAPDESTVPVFPSYDLASQFRVIELVAASTSIPVPTPRWLELDAAAIGSPFFVMDRIDGRVPPDVMPYNFGSWLLEADPADQRHLQDATVEVLAGIHAVRADTADLSFLELDEPGDTALARHVASTRSYYRWVAEDRPMPLLETCFDWLQEHWPTDEGPSVLNWGDARVGNVLYDGFDPVAVLDWEMAGVGPPEIDLAWGIFIHRFFEDIARGADLPGMPTFMRAADVAATYEAASGYAPRDLEWFLLYAALRHGIVMSRVHRRMVHLGEAEMPDDPDDTVLHRATLSGMLDGSYWSNL